MSRIEVYIKYALTIKLTVSSFTSDSDRYIVESASHVGSDLLETAAIHKPLIIVHWWHRSNDNDSFASTTASVYCSLP